MKTLILSMVILTTIISCKKENEHKNLCPVITKESVPSAVQESFNVKYSHAIVKNWFYKDNSLYCVSFTSDSRNSLSTFNTNGQFIKEEADIQDEGDDEEDDDDGCTCELPDND